MNKKILLLSFCLISVSPTVFSQNLNLGELSKPHSEEEIANFNIVKDILGFPDLFKYSGSEEDLFISLRYRLSRPEETALKWYNDGLLTGDNRKQTILQIIKDQDAAIDSFPVERKFHYRDLRQYNHNKQYDPDSLIAAFTIAAKMEEFDDIKSFLRFSRVYTELTLTGRPIINYLESPSCLLSPIEVYLSYFPAARALLIYPENSIPKLLKITLDENELESLRLRAATFLNTFNSKFIDWIIQSNDNDAFNQKLQTIKDDVILWFHTLERLDKDYKTTKKKYWKMSKKRLGIPEDVDVERKINKGPRETWRFLEVDADSF